MKIQKLLNTFLCVAALGIGINAFAWGSSWTDIGGTTHYNFGGNTGTSWTDIGGTTHYNFGGTTGTSCPGPIRAERAGKRPERPHDILRSHWRSPSRGKGRC